MQIPTPALKLEKCTIDTQDFVHNAANALLNNVKESEGLVVR
jgi:hypothetical protein